MERVFVTNEPVWNCCGRPKAQCTCPHNRQRLPDNTRQAINNLFDQEERRINNATARNRTPEPMPLPQWDFQPVGAEQPAAEEHQRPSETVLNDGSQPYDAWYFPPPGAKQVERQQTNNRRTDATPAPLGGCGPWEF